MPTRLNRDQQQELTRQRLLDGALGVFRQRGFASATVDEIAELAGYSRGALYSHFGSKEALLIELLELHTPAQHEAFRRTVEAARSEAGVIRAIVAVTLPSVDSVRGQVVDTVELAARLVDKPELSARLLNVQKQSEALMGWCAEEICRHRGISLTVPAEQVGMLLTVFLSGLSQRLLVEPNRKIAGQASHGLLSLIIGSSTAAVDAAHEGA